MDTCMAGHRWAGPLFFGLILLLPLHAAGLRTNPPDVVDRPTGEPVQPVGRHIQCLYRNFPHGMTDRIMKWFRPLVALGIHYNATVHITGGARGPGLFLNEDHSIEVAESWGRYFDLTAHDGNPWHEPENFVGCRDVQNLENKETLLGFFRAGELCVNIISALPIFGQLPVELRMLRPALPVSPEVRLAAGQFLQRYGLEEGTYGSCHIRRCDYLSRVEECTDPDSLFEQVSAATSLKTWLFFTYAEESYRKELRERLAPLGLQLLFEDEVRLNEAYPRDNYFTYLLGKYLNGGAQLILETHHCSAGRAKVYSGNHVDGHGLFLPRRPAPVALEEASDVEEAYMEAEQEFDAVCDDRYRGAKLLKPGAAVGT